MLRREARAQLRGPSVLGDRLAYVRATYRRQQVMIGPLRPAASRAATRALYGTTPERAAATPATSTAASPPAATSTSRCGQRPPAGVTDTLTTTATSLDAVYFTRVRKRAGPGAGARWSSGVGPRRRARASR